MTEIFAGTENDSVFRLSPHRVRDGGDEGEPAEPTTASIPHIARRGTRTAVKEGALAPEGYFRFDASANGGGLSSTISGPSARTRALQGSRISLRRGREHTKIRGA
ncbi:MAG: hypothetical protein ACLRSW_15275 [Christensenellaceae bacterium]